MTRLTRRFGLALLFAAAALPAPLRAQEQATPPTDEARKLEEMHGRLEGMTEQLQTLQTDTDKLKKFKFSGYLQARWETAETRDDSVRVSGTPPVPTPANNERFYIRRGRLKLTYDSGPLSQAVVYFDGGADRTGVRVPDVHHRSGRHGSVGDEVRTRDHSATHTLLSWVTSSSTARPFSRPYPDCL